MKYTYKQTGKDIDKFEFTVTAKFDELDQFKEQAYQKLAAGIKVPGFRPGKAPRKTVEPQIMGKIVEEAVGKFLPAVAVEIVDKEGLKPVTSLDYNVTKLGNKEGIEFTFSFVNYPEIKLADYSKIKIKKAEVKIEQKEVDEVIFSIVRSAVKPERIRELTKVKEVKETSKKDGKEKSPKTKEKKEDEHKDHNHSQDRFDFELNDALIAELGYKEEKTLKDIRASVEKRLKELKENQTQEEFSSKVLEEAVKLTKLKYPKLFLEREIENVKRQFMSRLQDLKLDAETYLATQGTTLEAKEKEWELEAKRRVETDLLLISIADQNKQVASDEDINKEILAIQDVKLRTEYQQNSNAREYVRTVITKQRGMLKLLEMVG